MAHLSIRLFGSFQVTLEGEPVTGFASDKVRALLAYLVTESDRPHRREALAGLLWPDYPEHSARTNLRRALANLRKAIGDHQAAPPFLHISRQTIQFNSLSDTWCDVAAFIRALEAEGPSPQVIQRLEQTVELYRGSFLEGFSVGDSVAFEEWVLLKRERLRRRALAALHRLAVHHEMQGEYKRALPYAWRQVELEPWQEEAQRQLMRLLALSGQRGVAVAQYEACRRALAEQLGVEPSAETTRLYQQIRDGDVGTWGPTEARPLTHKTGGAERSPPHRSADMVSGTSATAAPVPSAQSRPSRRRIAGGRLTLVGGGLLLLVLVSAIAFFAFRAWGIGTKDPEPFESSDLLATLIEGSKIVAVCESKASPQICVYDAHTGKRLLMTADLAFEIIGIGGWSPDGRQIVFSAGADAEPSEPPRSGLYCINADGSNLKQLTAGTANDVMPAWSPDGAWIAFHRDGALWLIRPDGSEAQTLWEEGNNCVGGPAWSPDSQQIAFLVHIEHDALAPPAEIWIISRQGTIRQLVHTFAQRPVQVSLSWDPEGRHILCHAVFEDGEQKLLLNANGLDEPLTIDVIPWVWSPNFWPQWGKVE